MAMASTLSVPSADTFDSTGAAEGDVLTADGAGKAAWQAPAPALRMLVGILDMTPTVATLTVQRNTTGATWSAALDHAGYATLVILPSEDLTNAACILQVQGDYGYDGQRGACYQGDGYIDILSLTADGDVAPLNSFYVLIIL